MRSIGKEIKFNYVILILVIVAFLCSAFLLFLINANRKTLQNLYEVNEILNNIYILEKRLLISQDRQREFSEVQNKAQYLKENYDFIEKYDKDNLIESRLKLLEEEVLILNDKDNLNKDTISIILKLVKDNHLLIKTHKSILSNSILSLEFNQSKETINYIKNITDSLININLIINDIILTFEYLKIRTDFDEKIDLIIKKLDEISLFAETIYANSIDPINALLIESILTNINKTKSLVNLINKNIIDELTIYQKLEQNKTKLEELINSEISSYKKKVSLYEFLMFIFLNILIVLSIYFIIHVIKRLNRINLNIEYFIKETTKLHDDYTYQIKIPTITYKEFFILAAQMNDMANKINYIITNLNEIVNEQTKQLTLINDELKNEIDKKNQYEKELLEIKKNLEILVLERTNELDKSNKELLKEINTRKQAQLQMAKLINAIEHSPLSILITNKEGIIEYANPYFYTLTGYTPEEIIGKTPNILKSGIHSKEFYDTIWKTILSGYTWSGEICNKKKNGELYWELAYISPVINESGEITNFVAVKEDITQKKQHEMDKLRIEKLQSLSLLTSGIAHDFNNILMSILSNIQLCKLYVNNPEKLQKKLEDSEKACDKATNLIKKLKTFSKDIRPTKELCDIRKIIEESASLALAGSKIPFFICTEDELYQIVADPTQMEQVFLNLIINARQAIPNNQGEIRIHLSNIILSEVNEYDLPEGNYVLIKVIDNGSGIPPEIIDKIFDPYFTTKKEGTGLGLSIIHSIIQNHKGYITVKSKPDIDGTEFTILLPAAD